MSEISLQVRRVTERVRQYYKLYGMRSYTRYSTNSSVIRGSKRLGFDEIECVVAESARGTSVGFYSINQLQGLLYAIPLFLVLLLQLLNLIKPLSGFLQGTGNKSLKINFLQLFSGFSSFNFTFIALFLAFIGLLFYIEYLSQKIRLDNLKSRFSFYSKDAIWQTREIPNSLIILMTFKSVFYHAWLIAIIYFAIFATTNNAITDLTTLYNSSKVELFHATIDAFSITMGLALGILIAHKAIELRKYYSRTDERNRISGGLTERRIDPILFGIESSLIVGSILAIFFSQTYFLNATSMQLSQFLFFLTVGGFIGGFVHQEGIIWAMSAYAISIFFTSLLLLFKTGQQSAYAYIVVIQFFFLPIPFIVILSSYFDNVLQRNDISSKDTLFDIIPTMGIISLISQKRKKEALRKQYEDSMSEIPEDQLTSKIYIDKSIFEDKSSNAYKMARHYFELVLTYTATFDEKHFVVLPTPEQLENWWTERTQEASTDTNRDFITTSDRILWDPNYLPDDSQLSSLEIAGKQMVLLIQ